MAGPGLIDSSGNSKIIEVLSSWGINLYAGVNGGGIIHLAKYLLPFESLNQANDSIPRLLNIPEHVAGYIPLGHYLATGKIAGGLFTTGGATLLGSSGLLDAKLHDIPAVYLIALNATTSTGMGPLQDVTPEGLNTISTIGSILGESCILIDDINKLKDNLIKAQKLLKQSKPVALVFYPDVLSKDVEDFKLPWENKEEDTDKQDIENFLKEFPDEIKDRRIVIYIGEEAERYREIKKSITEFSEILKAPIVYSMNAVNAVEPSNKYAAGYISFGFNDYAKELWDSLTEKDIVVFLGFDPGEYELNMGVIPGDVWHFTDFKNPYGSKDGNFKHRVKGSYRQVKGNIVKSLKEIIPRLKEMVKDRKEPNIPENLNSRKIESPSPKQVDVIKFYQELVKYIQPNTIIFNDVSQAYKDFQYVTQRPIDGLNVYSAHRGSVMGHSLGMGIGAKIADPKQNVNIFAGDGCFAYFGGALAYARDFGISIWIIDNGNYHIVDKGLDVVMPKVDRKRHHSILPRVDFAGVAEKFGWESYFLKPNLENLKEIMEKSKNSDKSLLVQIPVDGSIVVGINPRLLNLRKSGTYL
jgi:acetolactate synthase-1/2/3 large subunit|tara:strand:+ start:21624 stop:23369 length:1746 start_codon:yes stop_codon:yes gene_type:complete